jgi:AcrR family transcriptional regulator
MSEVNRTVTSEPSDGTPKRRRSSSQLPSPSLRQPAPELGARAKRTIARILDATREVFLARGYRGTSIDEITRVAGVSRASFYTYFPSKRDALLALGADSRAIADSLVDDLGAIDPRNIEAIAGWVERYFRFLDDYGSFVLAWSQAAHDDPELLVTGMKGHLATCRHLGQVLENLRGEPLGDPIHQGLLLSSMLERAWRYHQLYGDAIPEATLCANAALLIHTLVNHRPGH